MTTLRMAARETIHRGEFDKKSRTLVRAFNMVNAVLVRAGSDIKQF